MSFELLRKSSDTDGFWGQVTSSIDWCESNYQVTHYVAEFANSFSSFSMVVAGLAGIYMHPWAENRFKLAFLNTILLGLGSVAFHGSLWKVTQAFDEVPMLYCVLTFVYIGINQRIQLSPFYQKLLATVLVLHSIFLTFLVTYTHGLMQFVLFQISFNSAHFFALYQGWKLYQGRKHRSNYQALRSASDKMKYIDPGILAFERGSIYYFSAIGCWLTDMLLCEYVNPHYSSSILPINPQLHAWWHVFISCGLYYMSILTLVDRMDTLKGFGTAQLHFKFGFIPHVVLQKTIKSPPLSRRHSPV